jgi:NAD(P)-dependent dehydrogenase (short-subunit alcohol dehydrogenase family)
MSEHFSLKGKIILMSGATGVLGSSMAKYLAQNGARILVLGRNKTKVDRLVSEIVGRNGKAFPFLADVTDENQLKQVYTSIEKAFGKIDVLINAAGGNLPGAVIGPDQNFTDANIEELRRVMELNYLGTFIPIMVFLPLMLTQNKGSILNISSMTAQRPLTRVLGYGSAKAAIDNLTRWLAVEFCQKYGKGIRVNAIAPGFFLTEQNRALLTEQDGGLTDRGSKIIEHTPMNEFGQPEDLHGAAHWLCSDASRFVTGTIVPVDGGFNAYSGV